MKEFTPEDFIAKYHKSIDAKDPVYLTFQDILSDPKQIELYILLNDQYGIPPADAFTRLHKDLCEEIDMANNDAEKRLLGALFGYFFQFMLDGGGAYKKGGSKRITDPTKRKARKKGGDLLFDTKGNQVYIVSASYFKRIKK